MNDAAGDNDGPARRAGGREVELKYRIADSEALESRLEELGLWDPDESWREVTVIDRYLDTRDRAVERAGYGLRLRQRNGRAIVSVKSLERRRDAHGGALHSREELEGDATPDTNPRSWPDSEARDLVVRLVADAPLEERFVLRQRRRERPVVLDGTRALLSRDDVVVERRGRHAGAFEALEVELVEGDEAQLAEVSRRLEEGGIVTAESRSKERIARELLGEPRAGDEPRAPQLAATDAFAEAGRALLRFHLMRMLAREPGTRAGDVESLHKMRVATRRMRAVWRVFEGAYRQKDARRYVAELRDVAGQLGAVRDLDVLLDDLAAFGASAPADKELLEPLAADWKTRRDEAFDELIDLLDSGTYRRFVTDYVAFTERPGAGASRSRAAQRVRDAAGSRTWAAYETLRAHEVGLAWADTSELHALRIDAKRLRYALESFRPAFAEDVGELLARLTAVQDHLGRLNDAEVARSTAREWLQRETGRVDRAAADATGRYLRAREREAATLARRFGPVWGRAAGREFRLRLARAVASL